MSLSLLLQISDLITVSRNCDPKMKSHGLLFCASAGMKPMAGFPISGYEVPASPL